MLLEIRLNGLPGEQYLAIEGLEESKEQWRKRRDAAKDNILDLLAEMCIISKIIESGKRPHLKKRRLELYMAAKRQFSLYTLSEENWRLYLEIKPAIDKAYSVVENYYYGIKNP